ncbi:hypothetical protein [uncultured Shewanella sp.]|uniref:hypothetical protein n=1 Tax=uncultured Shewanella sp. TaxID=173975 RepID=UPI0026148BC9|nr:hypothetical protein [uncultured Shewanella sp.]
MKKLITASILAAASIVSSSAFALTSDQLNLISQERADYLALNGVPVSWQQACNNIVNAAPDAPDTFKSSFVKTYKLETCPETDFSAFFACKDRNTANINTQSVLVIKDSITAEDCSSLPL